MSVSQTSMLVADNSDLLDKYISKQNSKKGQALPNNITKPMKRCHEGENLNSKLVNSKLIKKKKNRCQFIGP